jgi:enoyl-CoA hydratase/carnithine racemase
LRDAELRLDEGVATLTFQRDDVRNALTGTALADDVYETCQWINRNAEVATLIITGAGKAFSAGGNIKDMQARRGMFGGNGIQVQDNYRHGIQAMCKALYSVEVPVIAAVNGAAIGAGLDLACMCDIRIGSTFSKFGETFVNLSLIPGDGGAWFLPRIVGQQRAAELTFSGRIIDSQEAKAIGLLLEVVPPDALVATATTLAANFAAKPREALRISKRLLRAGQAMGLSEFLDTCAAQQSLCHASESHAQALSAMLTKD